MRRTIDPRLMQAEIVPVADLARGGLLIASEVDGKPIPVHERGLNRFGFTGGCFA